MKGIESKEAHRSHGQRGKSLRNYALLWATVMASPVLLAQESEPLAKVPIATLRAVPAERVTWDESSARYRIEGTITHLNLAESAHFIADESGGIYLTYTDALQELRHGDRVEMTGFARPGVILPQFQPESIEILERDRPFPLARALDIRDFGEPQNLDCQVVTVSGYPRRVKIYEAEGAAPVYEVIMEWRGQRVEARLSGVTAFADVRRLRGAHVAFRGVAAVKDPERDGLALSIFVADPSQVEVLESRDAVRQSSDWTPLEAVYDEQINDQPIRIRGLLGRQEGNTLSIVDQTSGIYVDFENPPPILVQGTSVECFGFRHPNAENGVRIAALGPPRALETPLDYELEQTEQVLDLEVDFDNPAFHGRRVVARAIFLNHQIQTAQGEGPDRWIFRRHDKVFGFKLSASSREPIDLEPFARYELRGIWDQRNQELSGAHLEDVRFLRKPPLDPSQEFKVLTALSIFSGLGLVVAVVFGRRSFVARRALRTANEQLKSRATKDAQRLKALTSEQIAALESSEDAILICGVDGRMRTFNQSFKQLWGIQVDPEQVVACDSLADDAANQLTDPEQFWELIRRMRETPGAESWDTLTFRDGRVVERSSTPQLLDGQPVGRIWRFHDITRREQERARLKAILNSTQELVICTDDQGRIILINQAALRMLDLQEDVALQSRLGNHLYPSSSGATLGLSAFEGSSDGLLQPTRGQRIPVEVSRTATPTPGGMLYTYVVRDIRERMAQEARTRELQEKRKQAEKLSAVGLLAGGVAHDFNNVIGSILLNAKFLRNKLGDDPKLASALADIIDSGEQGKELVTQVLTFSRQDEVDKGPVALESVIGAVAHELRTRLPPSISILTEGIEGHYPVLANAPQMRQLFTNLGQNGAQAITATAGSVTFRIGVQASGDSTPSSCVVEVEDTGSGMDAATQRRIFDPFFTTKAVGKGVGLGLAVVHGIVKNHGGTIEAHSKLGEGARFRIELPLLDHETNQNN